MYSLQTAHDSSADRPAINRWFAKADHIASSLHSLYQDMHIIKIQAHIQCRTCVHGRFTVTTMPAPKRSVLASFAAPPDRLTQQTPTHIAIVHDKASSHTKSLKPSNCMTPQTSSRIAIAHDNTILAGTDPSYQGPFRYRLYHPQASNNAVLRLIVRQDLLCLAAPHQVLQP
jgi:hypothetical protein